jgi:hypothetical protein
MSLVEQTRFLVLLEVDAAATERAVERRAGPVPGSLSLLRITRSFCFWTAVSLLYSSSEYSLSTTWQASSSALVNTPRPRLSPSPLLREWVALGRLAVPRILDTWHARGPSKVVLLHVQLNVLVEGVVATVTLILEGLKRC